MNCYQTVGKGGQAMLYDRIIHTFGYETDPRRVTSFGWPHRLTEVSRRSRLLLTNAH